MAVLTTLAAVKAYAGITNSEMDALITSLITRVSAAIENYVQGVISQQAVSETRNGNGGAAMLLADYPVTSVESLVIDGQTIPPAAGFGLPGWRLADRLIVMVGYAFNRGRANVVVNYTAGFATIPADIEQACIESVLLTMKRRDHVDVSSKSLGGETVTFITAEITPSAKKVLNSYCRVAPL